MHNEYYQPSPGYGDVTLPINIGRRLIGNSQFDITPYIDMRNYRGYRIVSIDITANAAYNASILDLLINSFSAGQISLDSMTRTYSIIPRNQAIIGSGADNLMVVVRGDTNLQSVVLRLSSR
jgi:hypothetical protein